MVTFKNQTAAIAAVLLFRVSFGTFLCFPTAGTDGERGVESDSEQEFLLCIVLPIYGK